MNIEDEFVNYVIEQANAMGLDIDISVTKQPTPEDTLIDTIEHIDNFIHNAVANNTDGISVELSTIVANLASTRHYLSLGANR